METKAKAKTTYERNGVSWDDAEVEQLKKEYLSQTQIKEMSKNHQRTVGAIRSRLIILFPQILGNK